ncbi:MAG: FAD-dependent oxidoreductase [Clostridiales bacterium]|nr:FAD-dependent oxidoreductase [Clostridiales bacterium]
MDPSLEPLFTPWKVGNVTVKNRIVMLPMEGTNMIQWEAKTGYVKGIDRFYADRQNNEVGLFIPGLIPLISIIGQKWVYKHKEVFDKVRPVIDGIHAGGGKVFFQISAGSGRSMLLPPILRPFVKKGFLKRISSPFLMTKWWWSAPDPEEPNVWDPSVAMDHFTESMIKRFVYAFGQTALRCKEAGVDGVEIHAVHEGYLLDQFAMRYTNHRQDAYGGTLENRLRFACEIVKEIKKVCGDDFPVSLRYSVRSMTRGFNQGAVPGEEFTEVGRTMEESERAVKLLEEAGYDMFNCDNGTYDAWYWAHPPVYAPLNMNLSYVEHIKKFTTKPVVCAGRMQPLAAAESIRAGRIDAMGVGRQLLCDPEYVTKIKEGRMDDIRPCIACHGACLPFNGLNGKGTDIDPMHVEMGRCVLNPWTNNETKYSKAKAKSPKKIAVIGGGIGGMETAIQASLRGHKVDLFEKTDRLGGVFNAAAAMSFKEKDRELLLWYRRMLENCGAAIHMNAEIEDIGALDADIIVIATGAKARTLRIPGAERAVTAADLLDGKADMGDRPAIIGGGLTGCEIAYELALQGKHPSVIEMTGDLVGARGICMANSSMLRELLRYHDVPAYLNAAADSITEEGVVINTPEGKKTVPADSVIMSVGYSPDARFAALKADKKLKNKVFFVGDCDKVGSLKTVIKQAYELVQRISYN